MQGHVPPTLSFRFSDIFQKVLASSFDRGQSISKEVARKLQLAVSDHRHAFVYVGRSA